MHGKVRTAARRAGVAGAVTGAALLAAGALPAAAWGDDHGHDNGHPAAAAGQEGDTPSSSPQRNSAQGQGHSSQGNSSQGNSASHDTADGHNPPGNNGTVKIHDTAGDHTVHNVPHVSCTWWVDLFGFDNGQRGDISLAGQAPTGKDVALVTLSDVQLSPDDAGGAANDWDSEFAFSATQGTSGATYVDLSALGAPAAQGYHIKLTVRTHQPGENGVKHKVFWVSPCGSAVAGTSASQTGGAESGTERGTGTEVAGIGVQAPSTGTGTSAVAPAAVTTDVLGLSMTRPAAAAATTAQADSASQGAQVLGLHLTRGGQLPFTGDNTLAALLAGVSSVAIGAGLVAAGRRRRTGATEA